MRSQQLIKRHEKGRKLDLHLWLSILRSSQVTDAIGRAGKCLRRRGLAGSAYLLASLACRSVYLRERHVWYLLDLSCERPQIKLPPGLRLVRTDRCNMENLKQIPAVGFSESLRRLGAGGDLWTVYEMDRAVFSCWIFRNRTPVFAARDGWLDLPPETVCLEDSMTLSSYRGKGIASATWSEIAAVLAHEGVSRIITKIEEQNGSARRAVEKTGFREIASMQFVRVGPASHVAVQPQGGSGGAEFLVKQLAH